MAEYIEQEVLKERFKKRLGWLKKDIHDEYSGALYNGCETDMELIDEISFADVVPVVHGRWVEQDDGWGETYYDCSACGESWTTVDGTPTQNNMKYCPNCGAVMDGGVDNAAD